MKSRIAGPSINVYFNADKVDKADKKTDEADLKNLQKGFHIRFTRSGPLHPFSNSQATWLPRTSTQTRGRVYYPSSTIKQIKRI